MPSPTTSFLFISAFFAWRKRRKIAKEIGKWIKKGKPNPPPHPIKQQTLLEFSAKYGLTLLIETGTFYGEMVEAMKHSFDHIISIELSEDLYKKACEKFKHDRNIEVLWGDSGKVLATLIKKIDRAALFWLDGHYSAGETAKGEKDTPIFEELNAILSKPNIGNVIIIDDARCFGTDPSYPSLNQIEAFVFSKNPNLTVSVKDDSIRIIPCL